MESIKQSYIFLKTILPGVFVNKQKSDHKNYKDDIKD